MSVYAVTMTLEFQVVASSRKQAEKFALQSIEDRCVTLEDAEMTVAKMQFVGGSPSALIDGCDWEHPHPDHPCGKRIVEP